jgi:hypothetical protein
MDQGLINSNNQISNTKQIPIFNVQMNQKPLSLLLSPEGRGMG